MKHYHILNHKGKTITMKLTIPFWWRILKRRAYRVCTNPFAYLDSNRNWAGDKYNPDKMCIRAMEV